MWDNQTLVEAAISPRWNTETTQGRGQFVRFDCTVQMSADERVEQVAGALIITREDGTGEVVATLEPTPLRRG